MNESKSSSFRDRFVARLVDRSPVVPVETTDPWAVARVIRSTALDSDRCGLSLGTHIWSGDGGIHCADGTVFADVNDPLVVLRWMAQWDQPGVFVMVEPTKACTDSTAREALSLAVDHVADAFRGGSSQRILVLVGEPGTLKGSVAARSQSGGSRHRFDACRSAAARHIGYVQRLAQGDSKAEERVRKLMRAVVESPLAPALVPSMVTLNNGSSGGGAMKSVRSLTPIRVDLGVDDIGGLCTLKEWLWRRRGAWSEEAASYGVVAPKGVLLVGVPGCGKSMAAKAIASGWGVPLLRFDFGSAMSKWVGESDQFMRAAIAAAEAASPCVLWIDEVEKGLGDTSVDGDSSGVSRRLLGWLLTWMQENQAPVFVVATSNDITRLPSEFLRKGRFDEIFFVDLPTLNERREIWRLQLCRRLHGSERHSLDVTTDLVEELASISDGFSGAEIEQVILDGLVGAFSERRSITGADLKSAVLRTSPLSVTHSEKIDDLRAWAKQRAVFASPPETHRRAESMSHP